MKAFKPILAILLVLLLVFQAMPALAETDSSGTGNQRAIHNSIIIDDDPTDGYEGDYVVIYNPSTTASNSVSTGNLTGLIETEIEPNVVIDPEMRKTANDEFPFYKIDVDSMLNEQAKEEMGTDSLNPAPDPVKASFSVGDTKTFRILAQYSPTGSSSVSFECLYVGSHCYIWTPVSSSNNTYPLDEIDSTYAKLAADEFDSKFDLMQSSFGNHTNGSSGDGKLHMLYYNINDGWNGSGGYIAGFFYQLDISNNGLPILNIDTYPGVYYQNPNSGNIYKRMDDTYNTMVHEYQHLINYSNTPSMSSWLNECFSAGAEEICYPGSSVVSRIQSWEDYYYSTNDDWLTPPAEFEYQTDFSLHNGYSMYSWSNSLSDVLALYAQVSFFAQYLYTRFGNTIFRQISDVYSSSEVNAITNATGVNCADLVRDFRIAVTANATQDQYGGIYGFKVQNGYDPDNYHGVENPWSLLSPIIFTGSACSIKGGGAITVKPVNGVFNPPSGAGSSLKYFGIKLTSVYTVTAISNNTEWGTVSVSDTKITASPAEGYYVAGYEVVEGTATAVIDGNIVRVTPESDCTIRVIFAPKPTCTVNFVASGNAEGSVTALIYDSITVPSTVSVNPDGWTFTGWTETRLPEETESKPVYYEPGAAYTVTGNVTLYAVYSRVEEGVGAPVYELVSSAPSDWADNYVITYRTVNSSSSPMYVMKGVSVSSNGTSIESSSNSSQYAVTGITLNGTTLSDVSDDYVFKMESHGSYYSIQNVKTGTYLGINSSGYLAGYKTYTSGNCDWTPGTKTNTSSATVAISSTYPIIAFYVDDGYFWAGSNNNSSALYVRFWKETNGNATYYTTDPVVAGPAFVQQRLLLDGAIIIQFMVRLPEIEGCVYDRIEFTIAGSAVEGWTSDRTVTYAEATYDETYGLYCFNYPVTSIQMADTVTATLYYSVNGTDKTLVKNDYSAKQYFLDYDAYQSNPENTPITGVMKNAIEATADYGHFVQAYLESIRPWTIGESYDTADHLVMDRNYQEGGAYTADQISAAGTGLAEYGYTFTNECASIKGGTFSLSLDSELGINVILTPVSGYTGTILVSVDGGEAVETSLQTGGNYAGRYLITLPNIKAHKLGVEHTFEAWTADDTTAKMTLTCSGLSYVNVLYTKLSNNEKAVNAAVAIYRYATAANGAK